MSYLIKQVTIIDQGGSHNGKTVDVLYKGGTIKAIQKKISEQASNIIEAKGKYLSVSWIDTFADFATPGFENRENINSGCAAAANGGFGKVILVPNTLPAITTATDVKSILSQKKQNPVEILPLGAITKNVEGKVLAEMLDMKNAGAVAFSDGWHPVQNEQILVKALEYVKVFDGVIVQLPILKSIGTGGLMNESAQSVKLGINAIPELSETLKIHNDIALAKYANSKIHIAGVSTEAGIELIARAKKEGVKVTCSVSPYHLIWTDEKLSDYDALYKLFPPLRTENDRKSLIKALKNGIVDCISSFHKPHDWDEKVKELEYAKDGMATIETVWPMLLQAIPNLSPDKWVDLLVTRPSEIFNIPIPKVEENSKVTLTLFDDETSWNYDSKHQFSIAYNKPFKDQTLVGKAELIY